MSSLRAAQKRLTYELFLAKGLELFEEKGYAATTVDDIASAAGSTRATFYLHFSSKAELMSALLQQVESILIDDDPPLTEVVRSGSRELVRRWLDHRMGQWEEIKPYLVASYQAYNEDAVVQQTEKWFEDVIGRMTAGLDAAGRFPAKERRIRCILAFGQLEYLSRRYFSGGWSVPRKLCLEQLTDSWCHLLDE